MSILEMVQSSRCTLIGSNLWQTYFSGSGKLKFACITPIWLYFTKDSLDFPWKKYPKNVKIDDTRSNIYWDKLPQVLVDSF